MATQQRVGVRGGLLICALQRAWELAPELCRLTALFWESHHTEQYCRLVMMELEALCVRVALMASCLLRYAKVVPVEAFASFRSFSRPRVWMTSFHLPDADSIPLLDLPQSDVLAALDARVRQLPFLERYAAPACHPDSSITSGRCVNCGSTDGAWLDDWAKFPEAYPGGHCVTQIFDEDRLTEHVSGVPIADVFQRVWQLCHAGGTGTTAEKIAEESGTIEDALKRLGCTLFMQFAKEKRRTSPDSCVWRTVPVITVIITEAVNRIRNIKPFEQTGVECLRDVVRHPKRTCGAPAAGSAKVRRVGT